MPFIQQIISCGGERIGVCKEATLIVKYYRCLEALHSLFSPLAQVMSVLVFCQTCHPLVHVSSTACPGESVDANIKSTVD